MANCDPLIPGAKDSNGPGRDAGAAIGSLLNPLKAIRAKCVDCCGAMPSLVANCQIKHCALHPFRMGRNPFRKISELSEAERAARSSRLSASRRAASPEFQGNKSKEGDL